jgi:hypothetical protein
VQLAQRDLDAVEQEPDGELGEAVGDEQQLVVLDVEAAGFAEQHLRLPHGLRRDRHQRRAEPRVGGDVDVPATAARPDAPQEQLAVDVVHRRRRAVEPRTVRQVRQRAQRHQHAELRRHQPSRLDAGHRAPPHRCASPVRRRDGPR